VGRTGDRFELRVSSGVWNGVVASRGEEGGVGVASESDKSVGSVELTCALHLETDRGGLAINPKSGLEVAHARGVKC
jgi:hypothetical protein